MIEYYVSPSIRINLWNGVLTDKDGNSRIIASAPHIDDVIISGDWPDGTDRAKMAQGISDAIKAALPPEEGGAE